MERGKLKPEHENCIQENYLTLKENIDCIQEITEYLCRRKIISQEDKERILLATTSRDKNEALLTTVLNGGPTLAFNVFCKALKKFSPKLWKELSEKFEFLMTSICRSDSTASCQCNSKHNNETYFDVTLLRILLSDNETSDNESLSSGVGIEKILMKHTGRLVNIVDYSHVGTECKSKLVRDTEEFLNDDSKDFHAFLFVARYEVVRNPSAYKILETFKVIYGSEVLKYYGLILLTYNDKDEERQINVEEWFEAQDVETKRCLEECGKRIVLVNTCEIDNTIIQKRQMDNFIKVIDNLQFNGRRYTLNEFKKAEGRRQLELRLVLQEKEAKITEKTFDKCSQMIKESKELKEDKIKNMSFIKMKAILCKNKLLKKDSGTEVLSDALREVDSTIQKLEKIEKFWADISNVKSECLRIQEQQDIQLKLNIQKKQTLNERKKVLKDHLKHKEDKNLLLKQKISQKVQQLKTLKEESIIRNENNISIINDIKEMEAKNKKLMEEIDIKYNFPKMLCFLISIFIIIVYCVMQHITYDNDKCISSVKKTDLKIKYVDFRYFKMIQKKNHKNALRQWYLSGFEGHFLTPNAQHVQIDFRLIKSKKDANTFKKTPLGDLGKKSCDGKELLEKIHQMDKKINKIKRNINRDNQKSFMLTQEIKNESNTLKHQCQEHINDLNKRILFAVYESEILVRNGTEVSNENKNNQIEIEEIIQGTQKSFDTCKAAVCTCCKTTGFSCQLLHISC
uniref:CARD domain-containing protein n=1 Tax=Biomphalaria glabrata TaxID=6526 RepID=A0A2C9LT45_BIOGL